ncbi:MAG: hypothetical protein IPK07_35845 [Deltaproteobacteria bacterium]|nr:hypothetical protein [Deltaproteobacteria bacterium]
MILNLLGFAIVFGLVAALGWVTRSFIATLVGSLALSLLVLGSVVVQLGSDVGAILDYAVEPKDPILVVLTDTAKPLAALWVKPKDMQETARLVEQMKSDDPLVSERAKELLRARLGPDVPTEVKGLPPTALIHALIANSVQTLDATALGRLAARVEHDGWTEAARGSFRLVKLDVRGPRALLQGHPTLPMQVPVATGKADGEFKVPFVLDCIAAPDCYDRLQAAVKDPNRAIAKLGDQTDLTGLLASSPEMAHNIEIQAGFLPPGGYANFLAAGLAFGLAGRLAVEGDGGAMGALLAANPVEIFPKTPTARLLDRFVALTSSGPAASLLQKQLLSRLHLPQP